MSKRQLKIEHLIGFLPFGFTSRRALYLMTLPCDAAYQEYSPDTNMNDRITKCRKVACANIKYIAHLLNGGYVEELRKKYGNPHWDEFGMLRLTPAGLHLLMGTPCAETESARIERCMAQNFTYRASVNFFKGRNDSENARKMLYDLASACPLSETQTNYMDSLLTGLVVDGDCTILANQINKAACIDLKCQTQNGMRQFRNWRESNIHALFAANSFLTPIDRRPIPVGWQRHLDLNNPPDCSDFPATTELSVLVEQSLISWYSKHPASFSFRHPMLDSKEGLVLESGIRIPYPNIPTYYSATEIPGFGGKPTVDYGYKTSGAQNTLNHNFCGLGVGMKANYLIYHTRPVKTPWSEKTENTSAAAVQQWLNSMNRDVPIMGANRAITNAIVVCNTVMQFAALFKNVRKTIGNNEDKFKQIGAPFSSVSIVILEHAGVQQIRSLMSDSPIAIETSLVYDFISKYPDKFEKSSDPLFQLVHKGRPVLVAHLLDYRKIYQAWMTYETGKRFFVMCYPEQVKYLKKLMPEADFL